MKRLFNLKNLFISFLIFGFLIFGFNFVFAADNANCDQRTIGLSNMGIDLLSDPSGRSCPSLSSNGASQDLIAIEFGSKVSAMVKIILGFTASIGLIAFVYAGVVILLSKGDPKAFSKGTSILKYTFGGILIIIFSYGITNFLTTTIPKITGGGAANTTPTGGNNSDCSISSTSPNVIKTLPAGCLKMSGIINDGSSYSVAGSEDCGSNSGKCAYVKKSLIDAPSFLPSDSVNSSLCGKDISKCNSYNGVMYCLRCIIHASWTKFDSNTTTGGSTTTVGIPQNITTQCNQYNSIPLQGGKESSCNSDVYCVFVNGSCVVDVAAYNSKRCSDYNSIPLQAGRVSSCNNDSSCTIVNDSCVVKN